MYNCKGHAELHHMATCMSRSMPHLSRSRPSVMLLPLPTLVDVVDTSYGSNPEFSGLDALPAIRPPLRLAPLFGLATSFPPESRPTKAPPSSCLSSVLSPVSRDSSPSFPAGVGVEHKPTEGHVRMFRR